MVLFGGGFVWFGICLGCGVGYVVFFVMDVGGLMCGC